MCVYCRYVLLVSTLFLLLEELLLLDHLVPLLLVGCAGPRTALDGGDDGGLRVCVCVCVYICMCVSRCSVMSERYVVGEEE